MMRLLIIQILLSQTEALSINTKQKTKEESLISLVTLMKTILQEIREMNLKKAMIVVKILKLITSVQVNLHIRLKS